MNLKTQEINGELYFFGRGFAPLLSTGVITFDRLRHDRRDVRKRVPFLADFRARVPKVEVDNY